MSEPTMRLKLLDFQGPDRAGTLHIDRGNGKPLCGRRETKGGRFVPAGDGDYDAWMDGAYRCGRCVQIFRAKLDDSRAGGVQ